MKKSKNLIYGEKPEFGNTKHIEFVQRIEKIFNGSREVDILEWDFYNKKGNEVLKVEKGNEVRCIFECPRCQNYVLISYQYTFNESTWYQTLIDIDQKCCDTTFKCKKCKQKFYCEDRVDTGEIGIYVKK